MTDKTEQRLEKIKLMAIKIEKEDVFDKLPLTAIVFLSEHVDDLTEEKLKYFIQGFKFGVRPNYFEQQIV